MELDFKELLEEAYSKGYDSEFENIYAIRDWLWVEKNILVNVRDIEHNRIMAFIYYIKYPSNDNNWVEIKSNDNWLNINTAFYFGIKAALELL